MEDVLRFRYEVYCEERGYLPPSDYPLGMELDEYDFTSAHFTVYGTEDKPVGYMRTVPAVENDEFPVFAHGLTAWDRHNLPPSEEAVECSRLMVRPDFRSRPVDGTFPTDPMLPGPVALNASALIQMKLVRLAYRHALENDVRWFYASVEPPLARRLNRLGFPLRQIGPPGEYFGTVTPYLMDLREMESTMKYGLPINWAFFDNPSDDADCTAVLPGEWHAPQGIDINGGQRNDSRIPLH